MEPTQNERSEQLTKEESLWLAAAVMQAHVNGDEEGAEAVASLADNPEGVRQAMAHAVQPGNAPRQGGQPQPAAKSMGLIPRLPAKRIPPSRFQNRRRPG